MNNITQAIQENLAYIVEVHTDDTPSFVLTSGDAPEVLNSIVQHLLTLSGLRIADIDHQGERYTVISPDQDGAKPVAAIYYTPEDGQVIAYYYGDGG
jgi:hypothetical protein